MAAPPSDPSAATSERMNEDDFSETARPPIQPNAEELRNGWTTETLTKYVARQERARESIADWKMRPVPRPRVAKSKYNPFRWRG